MNTIQNSQRKKILSNPVTEFKNRWPEASSTITAINELQQQKEKLKKELKEQQSSCKSTSKKIGCAKKDGLPIDDLLHTMRGHSARTKELDKALNNIHEKIIFHFEKENDEPAQVTPPAALPLAREHETTSTKNSITIKLLADETSAWNDYLDSNPASSLYHRAEWRTLIKMVFNHEGFYFFALINNEIVGILPLIRLKSKLFGDFMVSMPYFNSGGALANSLAIEDTLIVTANEHAAKLGVTHIEYRDDIPRKKLSARTEKVNMILLLPKNSDDLQASFSSKLRSQIKRAQREKPEIIFGGAECLDDFYHVFSRNMRDLGTPVYSKQFFSEILKTFPDNSKIIVIRLNGKPVSSAFLLGQKTMLEIPWASTIKEVNHLSMNMVMYWEILKYAVNHHYQYFDFGRSSKDSGTFRFKKQWGAQAKQCYWHYWSAANTEPPKLNPNNPKYALAIKVWKKLPITLTLLLGPLIVKNLP